MMTQDGDKHIQETLFKNLEPEIYAKFQQVLDFIAEPICTTLFDTYNRNLKASCSNLLEIATENPSIFNKCIGLKTQLHSFRLIGQIGKFLIRSFRENDNTKAEEYLVVLIKILVYHGLVNGGFTANFALVELEQLSKYYGSPLWALYQQNRSKILRVIIKAILKKLETHRDENCSANGLANGTGALCQLGKSNCVIQCMIRSFELFGVDSIAERDTAQSLVIVTYLILKDKYLKSIELFLKHLASFYRSDVAQLLNKYIDVIVVTLLLDGKMSTYDMSLSLKRLCAIADRTHPSQLLANKLTNIKGSLLLNYSVDAKRVKDALYYLSTLEDRPEMDQPFQDAFDDETTLMEYIFPDLIGILLHLDLRYEAISKDSSPPGSVNFIKSLTTLISMLTIKQVETIHPKLLSTLCLILRFKRHEALSLALVDLWKEFILKLGKDLKSALLINICVAIHELIDDCPREVAELYTLLLSGKPTKEDQSRFKCLFFIPDKPGFEKIYKCLTPFVHRGYNKSSLHELELAINCALPLTKFENRKCHILAASHIRELLRSNAHLLTSQMLVNLEEPLNEVISRTIESLLTLLSTKECGSIVAECLGIIGAVNPVRLNHLIYGNIAEEQSSYFDLEGKSFQINLIEMLKNSLLSDRQSESEAASYAIQVILKTNERYVLSLSQDLSDQAMKAVDLCKNTGYVAKQRSSPTMDGPLYVKFKNEGQYSYNEWLDKFFLVLASMIEKESVRNILHACTLTFKFNQKFAEYLLPVVLIYVMVTRKADISIIRNEIMAIVTDTTGVSSQDYDTVLNDDYEHSIQTLHLQCSNFVFCLIDSLMGLKSRTPKPDRCDLEPINRLLKDIPKDKLAILACKCRANARALSYFDQYYFETKNWNRKEFGKESSFDAYWTSLQKVYMALDDSHEAAGVQMRRTSPITVADDIANLESAGRFDKASIHYESLLGLTDDGADKKQLIEDALRCLSNQGDDQRLYERSKRLMTEYPAFKRSILPAAVEAFWKIGKWDELDIALNGNPCNSMLESTSISQGSLLSALRNTTSNIDDKVNSFWERSIKPLSIAMIDRSAYFRGYQTLLILHGIQDYRLASEVLIKKQFETQDLDENTTDKARRELEDKLRSLFSTWSKRNKLVQPSLMSLEPLLAWQRSIALLYMEKYAFVRPTLCKDIGSMWLSSAEAAREARCFDRSFYCLAQAQKWFGPDLLVNNLELQVACTTAQAVLNWEQGESTEAIRCLKAAIQRLQNHKLYEHLETRRSKNEDIRRKMNNPYHHPDAEPYFDINSDTCEICSEFDQGDRESFAKLKILLTRYTEEAAAGTPRALLNMYEECVHLSVNQEEVYLLLARYYDKLANYYTENPQVLKLSDKALNDSCSSPSGVNSRIVKLDKSRGRQKSSSQDKKDKEVAHREDVISKLMEQSVLAFGNSLKWGVRYLEESMPRMLNIWFDLGTKKCLESMSYYPRAINSRIESTVRMFDALLLKKDSGLPSYYFMSALSLLLSRVCHPHASICDKTSRILEQLLIDYPHQMLWRLQAMINDDIEERKKAGDRIIKSACKKSPSIQPLFQNYQKQINLLRCLCKNFTDQDPRRKQMKLKKLSAGLNSILDIEPRFGNLLIDGKFLAPVQNSINPILPTECDYENLKQHQIYPERYMYFVKCVKRDCWIYNSLQQPRRVDMVCENGKTISILCKAHDDLRKDSRCIEFFNLLNRILRRSGISSARFFEISTFLVLPLENFAGILEMVPNCETLRSIVERLYRETLGSQFSVHELLKKRLSKDQNTDADSYQSFVDKVLPRVTPPVLQEFYKRKFTEPISWYMARLAYARSLALTSMVGYIVGLGDRHLDNILIDIDVGRIVHVDFNLLFHQADLLPVPEVVPFRLTQNIVAALGPMGTEGNFRKFSEIAVRIMRKEKELLLTTLKPFLHDPCCEWTKDRENRGAKERDAERDGNRMAKERIEIVERKLKGFPRSGNQNKPLTVLNAFSVEAQVDILIDEASDLYNLSQMYYGWSPHI